jgi:hypothetical protein
LWQVAGGGPSEDGFRMGILRIDGCADIRMTDGVLDHVFTVLVAKLRRHEPVMFSWLDAEGHEEQLLVNPTCAVRAEFDCAERAPLEHDRLERLMVAANSILGISVDAASAEREAERIPTPVGHRITTRSRSR